MFSYMKCEISYSILQIRTVQIPHMHVYAVSHLILHVKLLISCIPLMQYLKITDLKWIFNMWNGDRHVINKLNVINSDVKESPALRTKKKWINWTMFEVGALPKSTLAASSSCFGKSNAPTLILSVSFLTFCFTERNSQKLFWILKRWRWLKALRSLCFCHCFCYCIATQILESLRVHRSKGKRYRRIWKTPQVTIWKQY